MSRIQVSGRDEEPVRARSRAGRRIGAPCHRPEASLSASSPAEARARPVAGRKPPVPGHSQDGVGHGDEIVQFEGAAEARPRRRPIGHRHALDHRGLDHPRQDLDAVHSVPPRCGTRMPHPDVDPLVKALRERKSVEERGRRPDEERALRHRRAVLVDPPAQVRGIPRPGLRAEIFRRADAARAVESAHQVAAAQSARADAQLSGGADPERRPKLGRKSLPRHPLTLALTTVGWSRSPQPHRRG